MTTYIEIHTLQSVPPANINRDDTGSPKTAIVGGTQRIRVSSQAWKRAIRDEFVNNAVTTGVRTTRIGSAVVARIIELAPELEDRASEIAGIVLTESKLAKYDEKKNEHVASAVAFISDGQLRGIAEFAVDNVTLVEELAALDAAIGQASKAEAAQLKTIRTERAKDLGAEKAVNAALTGSTSLDLALFGRMFASNKSLSVDAAAQVQHAYSVHAAEIEYDFFTAVDELSDTSGSAMMGTTEFASATFYRQTALNVDALKSMVGDDYVHGVREYIRGFIESMPTGKQNSTSHRTLPVASVITIRNGGPRNFVDAFTYAVVADELSIVENASNRLAATAAEFDLAYGTRGATSFIVRVGDETAALDQLGTRVSIDDALDGIAAVLNAAE